MELEPLSIVRLGYGMTVSVTPLFMNSALTGTSERGAWSNGTRALLYG